MMENAKIEKLKCEILGDFQTLSQKKIVPAPGIEPGPAG